MPWTNPSNVAVTRMPIYNERQTGLCNSTLFYFQNYMNNLSLPFSFDSAIAVVK